MQTFKHSLSTDVEGIYSIEREVEADVAAAGVENGILVIFTPHSTSGIMLNENSDPEVFHDLLLGLREAFPDRPDFRHLEGNAKGHLKSAVVGPSMTMFIEGGKLLRGGYQGIYFCEFDGPRERSFYVKIF